MCYIINLFKKIKSLRFTTETCEDFPSGWLPTLDLELRVDDNNTVQHRFFEKSTSSKVTVQERSAMEENIKVKFLVMTWSGAS